MKKIFVMLLLLVSPILAQVTKEDVNQAYRGRFPDRGAPRLTSSKTFPEAVPVGTLLDDRGIRFEGVYWRGQVLDLPEASAQLLSAAHYAELPPAEKIKLLQAFLQEIRLPWETVVNVPMQVKEEGQNLRVSLQILNPSGESPSQKTRVFLMTPDLRLREVSGH